MIEAADSFDWGLWSLVPLVVAAVTLLLYVVV